MLDPMTVAQELRNPRLQALVEQAASNDAEARRLAGDLSLAQLRWRPPEGGWGVGDCLEHLVTTAGQYRAEIAPALTRAHAGNGGETYFGGWRSTLSGRFVLWGLRSSLKLPAPRRFRPPPEARPDALDRFLDSQRDTVELMRSADGLDLGGVRLSSPIASLARLNLGEAFEVLQVHAARHLGQARRVRERDGFPGA